MGAWLHGAARLRRHPHALGLMLLVWLRAAAAAARHTSDPVRAAAVAEGGHVAAATAAGVAQAVPTPGLCMLEVLNCSSIWRRPGESSVEPPVWPSRARALAMTVRLSV